MRFFDRRAGQTPLTLATATVDLHMLQAHAWCRSFPCNHGAHSTFAGSSFRIRCMIHADLEIQFAGQTAHYKNVPLRLTTEGNDIKISGTIPATLSDFKIGSAIAVNDAG